MKKKVRFEKMKRMIKKIGTILVIGCLLGGMTGCGSDLRETSADEGMDLSKESQSLESQSGDETGNVAKSEGQTDQSTDRANADTDSGEVKILAEGDIAPDFTAKLVDGGTFQMSEHDGEIVLLNFFATWCGPCMREMPAFEMLKNDGYDHLAILCVNCMEKAKTVDALVKEKGFTFPIAYDEDGKIEKYYPTDGIPYTLVINQGKIAKIYLGAMDAQTQYEEYKASIDACLAK